MDTDTTSPAPVRSPQGMASAVVGGIAIALSLCGQLLAARRYATDVNAGHPSADQSMIHMLAVAPSLILSLVAIGVGCSIRWDRKGHRALALLGVTLGGIAIFLTLTDALGTLAAQNWIIPVPGGR